MLRMSGMSEARRGGELVRLVGAVTLLVVLSAKDDLDIEIDSSKLCLRRSCHHRSGGCRGLVLDVFSLSQVYSSYLDP